MGPLEVSAQEVAHGADQGPRLGREPDPKHVDLLNRREVDPRLTRSAELGVEEGSVEAPRVVAAEHDALDQRLDVGRDLGEARGLGLYPHFVHIDVRDDAPYRWGGGRWGRRR